MLPHATKVLAALIMAVSRDAAVTQAAHKAGISVDMALAVAHVEDFSGNPYAVSKAGAIGIMQVMPGWIGTYRKACGAVPSDSLYNIHYNACLGTHIIRHYLTKCHKVVYCALAGYNGATHFKISAKHYNDRVKKANKRKRSGIR